MNYERALAEIDRFISELDRNHSLWENKLSDTDAGRTSFDGLTESIFLMQEIAGELEPQLVPLLGPTTKLGWKWRGARDAAVRLRGILKNRERAESIVGPRGPQLAAVGLHVWVWEPAARLWDSGHYREAVGAAASVVDENLKAKLGRADISGVDLVTQAFTKDEPGPDSPRLRFPDVEPGSQEWTSRHEGARNFGVGCMQAIRNPSHHGTEESDEQVALEQLAALSVLARWIDEAEVVRG
jgi:uncharacterized protein (TIGR02391 family)